MPPNGYGSVTKGYKMYDVESKRIFFSRNVTFDELTPPKKLIDSPTSPLVVFPDESELAEPVNQTPDHNLPVAPIVQPNPAPRPELDNPVPEPRRSTRVRRPPDRYGDWDYSLGEDGLSLIHI